MTGKRINGAERGGKYAELLEAVEAMRVGDLLRWDLPKENVASIRTRLSQAVTHSVWLHWHAGLVWIVRYE